MRFLPFLFGYVFALGLGISQMSSPSKVRGFLNLAGNWDPTLLVVFASALAVFLIGYFWIFRISPIETQLEISPPKKGLDWKLLTGSSIFGIGWGMVGFCPGPVITSLASGVTGVYIFFAAMTAGIYLYKVAATRFS